MAEPDVLRVEHITKRFGPVVALRDVSLTLRKGEVLGLLGDNGAGKSTLMKIICGFEKPDSGSMLGPSLGARSGSGWVSRKRPSAPAATAARVSAAMCSRVPPLAPPSPMPGRCTLCVPSKITGALHASRIREKPRMSTTRSP